jgi:NADPH-dependent 2,4-dienoyl-CoA reductase/sulfur reductase-like enzyme/nitrite reductase/ring-hydroxylating ferredoxin subunit
MSEDTPAGPDLSRGVPLADLPDGGCLAGHVDGEEALLVRRGDEVFAIAAHCTHYHGPLADGLVIGEMIRCPWHHACFDLRTGAVLHAPARDDLKAWRVQRAGEQVFVGAPLAAPAPPGLSTAGLPSSVVIVGGGAAGAAAAETLRREGYQGPVTILSADAAQPCDRPNLSKDYLAGTAEADWIPLRPPAFYADQGIELRCGATVTRIDVERSAVTLAGGSEEPYGALLLATGATPIRLQGPGADLPHVHVLRTLADCEGVIAQLATARRAVVVGASFIGLEAAASLRTRGLEVAVVAPEARPMERILGAELGDMVRALHESRGVVFHLGATVAAIEPERVRLSTGETLPADLVVAGIGVRPETSLAEASGLAVERGVTVDAYLRTSAPNIWAAGDIARWPDPHTGENIRVEHWVVAQRQGAVAARNILGRQERFTAAPFFWSQHYDLPINYVGHAERWDRLEVDGDPAAHHAEVTFWSGGRKLAVATVYRDVESLEAEATMEQEAD